MKTREQLQSLIKTINTTLNVILEFKRPKQVTPESRALLCEYINNQKDLFFNLSEIDALTIIKDDALLDLLHQKSLAILASTQPAVAREFIDNRMILHFDAPLLSSLVTCYVIGNTLLYRQHYSHRQHAQYLQIIHGGYKNPVNEEDRQQICLAFANDHEVVNKINSAAKILLFSDVKKSQRYLLENLSVETRSMIEDAFDICTTYPVEFNSYQDHLWPALAGFGIVDYSYRYSELYERAMAHTHSGDKTGHDPRAYAEILITIPELSQTLTTHYNKPFSRHFKESNHYPNKLRFFLAIEHQHIALLLLKNPSLRGEEGEITESDLKKLHDMHFADTQIVALEIQISDLENRLKQLQRKLDKIECHRHTPSSSELIVSQSGGRYRKRKNVQEKSAANEAATALPHLP